jgi:probable rRNA maturation factor
MQFPDVVDLQRKTPVDVSDVKDFVRLIQRDVPEAADKRFVVAFVSDRRMATLNSTFRDKNATTDVLSFRHEPDEFDTETNNLGDIVISAEQAARQAGENSLTLKAEIRQLILHGVLHLCGYDHETDNGEMDRRELELREQLGL